MNLAWENIAECLRAEIAEYGGLLHLFEEQQRFLFLRDPDAVLRLSLEIDAQVARLHDCRGRREQACADFARVHGHAAAATLRSMLPSVDGVARPLLEALIGEVNRLIHRTRRVTRHNHALLSRVIETHQEFLRLLRPEAFARTYAPNGRMSSAAVRTPPALQVAG